eukprot:2027794-Ditylum_brightwellii.AAC.1
MSPCWLAEEMPFHLNMLKVGKLQSWHVVLPDGGVDTLGLFGDAKGFGDLFKELLQWEQVTAGRGESHILALHLTLYNDGLELAAPQNWAISNHDQIPYNRTLIVFSLPETHKSSINKTVNLKVWVLEQFQNHAFVACAKE